MGSLSRFGVSVHVGGDGLPDTSVHCGYTSWLTHVLGGVLGGQSAMVIYGAESRFA